MALTRRSRRRDTIGTLGDMEYLDASGLWVPVSGSRATGKTPTVKSDGTIEWAAPGGASSVLLSSQTVSAVAAVNFTSVVSSTYDDYILEWGGLTPSGSASVIGIQLSTNNGSSYITTGYDFGGHIWGLSTNFSTYLRSASTTALSLAATGFGTGAAKAAGTSTIHGANTSEHKILNTLCTLHAGDGNVYHSSCGARYGTNTTFDAFRVLDPTGGATISGRFRLYGLTK